MAHPKVDPLIKRYGVCGCVSIEVKEKIRKLAAGRGISVGAIVGELIEGWIEGQGEGEREIPYRPYRPNQDVKPARTHGGREGPLGKEKRESEVLKRIRHKGRG